MLCMRTSLQPKRREPKNLKELLNNIYESTEQQWPQYVEHCDVLSMQMDSDLLIYRTTLVRTFQVTGPIRSSIGVMMKAKLQFWTRWSEKLFRIIILNFGNCVDRSDQIFDRSYDEATVIGMNRMFIRWTGPAPAPPLPLHNTSRPPPLRRRTAPAAAACRDRTCFDHLVEEILSVVNSSDLLVQTDERILIPVVDLIKENLPPPTLKCRIPRESGRSQAPRRQQDHTDNLRYKADFQLGSESHIRYDLTPKQILTYSNDVAQGQLSQCEALCSNYSFNLILWAFS
ncbi:putative leucine-rich repeat receptor-like protein kinase [Dorcoceras hygrometricum]|uniref:Putative leucine-rich repeat receptor-like protein kinase n=1 Tax=Dorcoceras hygrometricum TaxID=472368 RepID=A0A2Z7B977_9LAMI|nr:putative leucine-rich repeat receptor-like protein kinase [Dorcoceras hygrometricum]